MCWQRYDARMPEEVMAFVTSLTVDEATARCAHTIEDGTDRVLHNLRRGKDSTTPTVCGWTEKKLCSECSVSISWHALQRR